MEHTHAHACISHVPYLVQEQLDNRDVIIASCQMQGRIAVPVFGVNCSALACKVGEEGLGTQERAQSTRGKEERVQRIQYIQSPLLNTHTHTTYLVQEKLDNINIAVPTCIKQGRRIVFFEVPGVDCSVLKCKVWVVRVSTQKRRVCHTHAHTSICTLWNIPPPGVVSLSPNYDLGMPERMPHLVLY